MWTNNTMTRSKKSQSNKAIVFNQNVRIAHRELHREFEDKLLKEKCSSCKIHSIKGHYEKYDLGGWSLHINSLCHHVRNKKYPPLVKNEEPIEKKNSSIEQSKNAMSTIFCCAPKSNKTTS